MKALYAVTILAVATSTALAKRIAPAKVPPVATAEAVYSAPHVSGGGVIEAHEPKGGKLLWRVRVYQTKYNPDLERDVQDVFIKSLSYDKDHGLLILSDERNRVWVIDTSSRKVVQVR